VAVAIKGPGEYRRRPPDQLAGKYLGFNYYTDGRSGWILQAVGVDEKRNLLEFNEKMLKFEPESNSILAPYTYDPSNGIVSAGDIFRVNTRE
jgi:hypothetical protein